MIKTLLIIPITLIPALFSCNADNTASTTAEQDRNKCIDRICEINTNMYPNRKMHYAQIVDLLLSAQASAEDEQVDSIRIWRNRYNILHDYLFKAMVKINEFHRIHFDLDAPTYQLLNDYKDSFTRKEVSEYYKKLKLDDNLVNLESVQQVILGLNDYAHWARGEYSDLQQNTIKNLGFSYDFADLYSVIDDFLTALKAFENQKDFRMSTVLQEIYLFENYMYQIENLLLNYYSISVRNSIRKFEKER